jgi:hypothetical protein
MPLPTVPDVQVLIKSNANTTAMRSINVTRHIETLLISRQIISTSWFVFLELLVQHRLLRQELQNCTCSADLVVMLKW